MTTLDRYGPGHRAARMGRVTAVLVVVALVLLFAAVALLVTQGSDATGPRTAVLPVNLELRRPGLVALLAAAVAVAATFLVIASLQTASAMQVLSRNRRVPRALPPRAQLTQRWLLGPLAMRALDLDNAPEMPATAVPSAAELAAVSRLHCTVLVPAHDEEAVLGSTLDSLAEQTRRPDRVVVIADNCTDATVEVARRRGVDVVETVGNKEKKAGALNQQLARVLPNADVVDVVMVMDADSTITPDFLEVALGLLEEDPDLIAVGGLFYGENGGGLIGQLQRNEFTRYQRIVARKLNRVFVLTGTASVIRSYALRAVAEARGTPDPRDPRAGVRHSRVDRGQRAHPGLEDLGSQNVVAAAVQGDHRSNAEVGRPVATTTAMAPRSTGEHRRVRSHPGHRDVLDATDGAGLRGCGAVVLPVADGDHPVGSR